VKALVIGSDPFIVERVRRDLQRANFEVDTAANGAGGFEKALENRYALIVMEMAPIGPEAGRLCDVLRGQRHRPAIVMLTSSSACADVYLPKLYDAQELMAHVRALLWQGEGRAAQIVQVGDLKIDRAHHRVTRAETEIRLSLREYSLLEALAINAGRVLTRDAIQEKVWQNEAALPKTVDVYIGRLRRLVDAGFSIPLIQTVRGLGYCLRSPDPEKADAAT
jgi:DNA-binding response OmpR family regulator